MTSLVVGLSLFLHIIFQRNINYRNFFYIFFILSEFVLRALDLVLLEGPSVLVSIVYGIFLLFKLDFTNHNNVDVLFTLIINIPGSLNNRKFIVVTVFILWIEGISGW